MPMTDAKPLSALELCEALRHGHAVDTSRLNRILRLDSAQGLLEVQAATPWLAIAAALRPGDARSRVHTTMPTVGQSIARNAAGPDGTPAVAHVASMALVTPEGELRRVSRERDAELFALTAGGQGLFGTLYSVTLRIDSLAQAVERALQPLQLKLQPPPERQQTLELLLPPQTVDAFMRETETRCEDWRMPLYSVTTRATQHEEDTYLRWARSDYREVTLGFAAPRGLGTAVRATQLRHELIDAAIALGGSFQIASTTEATREQSERCYPELREFLAEKRRFDPHERLVNTWYLHQRSLLERKPCEVRWAN
jgi:FAD/FMN-containing dehydrogenase